MDDNTTFMILDEEDYILAVAPSPTVDPPTRDQIEAWLWDGYSYATDGCHVLPEEYCPHGHPSWLIELGLI